MTYLDEVGREPNPYNGSRQGEIAGWHVARGLAMLADAFVRAAVIRGRATVMTASYPPERLPYDDEGRPLR